MVGKEQYEASHCGEFRIGPWLVHCAVLEDGTRVISQRDALMLFDLKDKKAEPQVKRLTNLVEHPVLNTGIYKETLKSLKNPIMYFTPDKTLLKGYPCEVIPRYCNILLKARKLKVLEGEAAMVIAQMAEDISTSLSDTGIVSLVDEATGYQDVRGKDALEKILNHYINERFSSWAKRFPDEYYEHLFRLRGWGFTGPGAPKPQVVGHITNDIIYSRLAPGVLEELQRLNPKRENKTRHHKHHQHLTQGVGHPALQQHIHAVVSFMKAYNSWESFKIQLDKAHPVIGDSRSLLLDGEVELYEGML